MRAQPPTNSSELQAWLVGLFPGFAAELEDSLYRMDDGHMTEHGVFSEFKDYYIDHQIDYSSPEVEELFRIAELSLSSDPGDAHSMANAVCTCFLESIACTDAGDASHAMMGPASLKFFDYWHSPYQREQDSPSNRNS